MSRTPKRRVEKIEMTWKKEAVEVPDDEEEEKAAAEVPGDKDVLVVDDSVSGRPPAPHVVVWSGGADSTLVLHRVVSEAREKFGPVLALTVREHNQISKHQLKAQARAQANYLKWARGMGHEIEHQTVSFRTKLAVSAGVHQGDLWLCLLAPYFRSGYTVHWAYIRDDDFWHVRPQFESAFQALGNLMSGSISFDYPLEWSTKLQVLQELQFLRVPLPCVWTCEDVSDDLEPCGHCPKCRSMNAALAELRSEPRKMSAKEIKKLARRTKPSWWKTKW